MDISISPAEFPEPEVIAHRAFDAARHVGLIDDLVSLELVFDAPEFEGSGFWQFERVDEARFRGSLYGAPADALRPANPIATLDSQLSGEMRPAELVDELDLLRLDRWLHRNLLQLDDLLQHRVRPKEVTADRSEAMQACWDVWTDGRLRHWQHPGLSLAERRRVFFRVFESAGALLPRHWETFHDLWDGRLADHEGLEKALDVLPQV